MFLKNPKHILNNKKIKTAEQTLESETSMKISKSESDENKFKKKIVSHLCKFCVSRMTQPKSIPTIYNPGNKGYLFSLNPFHFQLVTTRSPGIIPFH